MNMTRLGYLNGFSEKLIQLCSAIEGNPGIPYKLVFWRNH